MSTLWIVLIGLAITWLGLVALMLIFKPAHARELARFVPDCLRLIGRVANDPMTPRKTRLMLGILAAYLAFPIDLVPDFLPIVGYLDDVVIVALALRLVMRQAGRDRITELWPGTEAGLRAVLRLS